MATFIASVLAASIAVVVLIILAVALILLFEIWMFIDVIRNEQISSDRKLLWCLGMIFIHPFIAIIYYFTDHRRPA